MIAWAPGWAGRHGRSIVRGMFVLPPNPDIEVSDSETVWDGRFPLERIGFRNRRFDGAMSGPRVWELWRRGRAAALLPYDPVAETVVLIEQFRLPALAAGLDPVMTELPAGLCDAGETPEATIRREAVEEIGIVPRRLHRIGNFLLTPGGSDENCVVYAGEIVAPAAGPDGLIGIGGLRSEEEDIRARLWPVARAIEAALDGGIANSVAAIALLWMATRRGWLRREWGFA